MNTLLFVIGILLLLFAQHKKFKNTQYDMKAIGWTLVVFSIINYLWWLLV